MESILNEMHLDDELVLKYFIEDWNKTIRLDNNFELFKEIIDFAEFKSSRIYDLIYFDAFSPDTQPEMWSEKNLGNLLTCLSTGGVFVTYCSKGIVKQALRNLGMDVRRFSGPLGKRHVIRATKN